MEYLYSYTYQHWLVAACGHVTSQALPGFSADRQSEPQHLEQPSVKKSRSRLLKLCIKTAKRFWQITDTIGKNDRSPECQHIRAIKDRGAESANETEQVAVRKMEGDICDRGIKKQMSRRMKWLMALHAAERCRILIGSGESTLNLMMEVTSDLCQATWECWGCSV